MTRLVVIGGSDAGIAAALRAREIDPSVDVSVLVADRYPNFSRWPRRSCSEGCE